MSVVKAMEVVLIYVITQLVVIIVLVILATH